MYPSFNSGQRWEELVSHNAEHFPLLGVNTLIGIEKQNNIGNLGSVILQSWIKKAKPIKLKKKKKKCISSHMFYFNCESQCETEGGCLLPFPLMSAIQNNAPKSISCHSVLQYCSELNRANRRAKATRSGQLYSNNLPGKCSLISLIWSF